MSSKRRIRRRSCKRKIRHVSEADARHHIAALLNRKGWTGRMNAYRCPFCNGWHVGHGGSQWR
ncbi:hypothetical protein TMEC54S_03488 [Thauera mechernichensis]